MEFLVIVEKGKSSYGAYVLDLPGCVAVGASRRHVMKLIREALPSRSKRLENAQRERPLLEATVLFAFQ